MRHPVASAIALVVLFSPDAHAVLITGYAEGVVTVPRSYQSPTGQVAYIFTLGESVSVRYEYDDSYPAVMRVSFEIETSGGYTFHNHGGLAGGDVQQGPGGQLLLWSAAGTWSVGVSFRAGVDEGRLEFHNDRTTSDEAFLATVTRAPDPLHAPEPGGLAMGVVGAGLVAFARWRRR